MSSQEKHMRSAHYLDDLSVGQQFVTGSHTLDEAQIKAFAAQFDPQPFHLDAESAKATLFKGLVASGWHTAAITMRLLVDSGVPLAGGDLSASEAASNGPARHAPVTSSPCTAR
jgi:acyl dehydratase